MTDTEKNVEIAKLLLRERSIEEPNTYHFPELGHYGTQFGWKDMFLARELKFDRDWRWTMLAVNEVERIKCKIAGLGDAEHSFIVIQGPKSCAIVNATLRSNTVVTHETSRQLATFEAIVEFAQWYKKVREL